jgi:Surface antigen variable number repeat
MKPAVSVLCVLVTVTTTAVWPAAGEDPGTTTRPRAASAPRVREVRFEGDPPFEPDTLKKVLKELEIRRVIPGIWTRRPRYEARAVEADFVRLRSLYVSHGYFDARVGLGGVTVDRGEAILTLEVQSGPKYPVRRVEIDGIDGEHVKTASDSSGEFPADALCARLLDARRIAESRGRLDFAAELEVSHTDASAPSDTSRTWVDVTARVPTGSAYMVGRINFTGHHRVSESTLRRAMVLQERSLFDVGKLRRSLARLNRSGLFEPLTLHDVEVRRNPDTLTADLTIAVREQPGRRWLVSGPLGPAAFGGSLQAAISSRLPPWGRGLFEASTYYLTFSLIGFSAPLVRLLPIGIRPTPPALAVLERPYLPGQALFSGFALSPQLSARTLLADYGLTHLDLAVRAALFGEPPDSSSLLIPILGPHSSGVAGGSEEARLLMCSPPPPRHPRLRRGAAIAVDQALRAFRPF